MAILTASQLQSCRQSMEADSAPPNSTKAQVNAALQAIEDKFEQGRSAINTAIDTATSPLVFSVAQKKKLFAYWARTKFEIERV